MPPAAPLTSQRTFGTTIAAVLLVPFGLALRDLTRVLNTAPWSLSLVDSLVFVIVAAGLGALVLGVLLLARRAWVSRLSTQSTHDHAGEALIGAIDATALSVVFVVLQSPSFLVGDVRVYVVIAAIALFAGLRLAWSTRAARTRHVIAYGVAIAALIGSSVLLNYLRWNGDWWLKLIPHALFVVAIDHMARTTGLRVSRRVATWLAVGVAAALLGSGMLLRMRPVAHNALLHGSIHARVWTLIVERFADWDRDGATVVLGGLECDGTRSDVYPGASERAGNGVDDNCQGGDGHLAQPTPHAIQRHGVAADRDVLVLSLDSLRWDAIDELRPLLDELGPVARFNYAVSPAPGTRESLSAMIRGRSVRQLRFESAPNSPGVLLWRDPVPTLGHVLAKAGYRTLTVPTSNVADPRIGIASGFDHVWVANHDARFEPATRSPMTQRYVPSEQVLPIALNAARETRSPLCVWLHLMEPHYPFHLQGAADKGSTHGMPRFRQSVRETAQRLVTFVREWKTARGSAPLVALFGDHGEEFQEHGGHHHASTVYAEQIRVTLLIAGPGVPEGQYDAPVSNASVPATLLDLLGLEIPRSMTEPTLLPSMLNEAPWPQLVVSEAHLGNERVYGYTSAHHRYVWDPTHGLEQLFDAQSDPTDQHDLAPTQPEALRAMRQLARAWDESH